MPKGIYTRTMEMRKKYSLSKIGNKNPMYHKFISEETRLKLKIAKLGGKNHQWKGDKVGYRAIHRWVVRRLGKPLVCTQCGNIGSGRKMHWANLSGQYKRDLNDWKRLCAKCHGAYDVLMGFRKHN